MTDTGRGFQGKAMVVSIDKATALRMHDKVRKHWAAETERVKAALDGLWYPPPSGLSDAERAQREEQRATLTARMIDRPIRPPLSGPCFSDFVIEIGFRTRRLVQGKAEFEQGGLVPPQTLENARPGNARGRVDLAAVKAADVSARDRNGVTPLQFASAMGSLEAMKILIARKADVNAADNQGATPLLWAACEPARVSVLLANGAAAGAKTKAGRTPLMVASGCPGALESVKMLIAKGADADKAQAALLEFFERHLQKERAVFTAL